VGEAHGEIEDEDGVLVIKRIRVRYELRLDEGADREKVQRAFEHHMAKCPVYRSIGGCIDVTTSLEVAD
jgi:uncharacterized OsmC-like protein